MWKAKTEQRLPGSPEASEGGCVGCCPLCGSQNATILSSSSSTWLTECPACVGRGVTFWVTVQAGHRAERERGEGRWIDPARARRLVDHRLRDGIPAYFQQADIDGLLVDPTTEPRRE